MCLQCNLAMSDERVIEDLKECIQNPQYELWNSCSLSHLFIDASGIHGAEARKLSMQLLEGYCAYAEKNPEPLEHRTIFSISETPEQIRQIMTEINEEFEKLSQEKCQNLDRVDI